MSVRLRGTRWGYSFSIQGVRYYGVLPEASDRLHAKTLEHEQKLKVYRGEWGRETKVSTFADFVDKVYMPYAKEHKVSWQTDEYRCEVFKQRFGKMRIDAITPYLLAAYASQQLKHVCRSKKVYSSTTVRKEMHLMSAILQMALDERLVTFNAARSLPKGIRKKLAEKHPRHRYLTLAEETALFNALIGRREHLAPLTRLALLTGMRQGELLSLTWDKVNLSEDSVTQVVNGLEHRVPPHWLFVAKSKNGLPRAIPLSQRAFTLLSVLREHTEGSYVFTSAWSSERLGRVKRGFPSACTEAGVHNFRFHDLRHTWATRAADAGATTTTIGACLGHKPTNITGGYIHATPGAMVETMELVAGYTEKDCVNFASKQAG